MDKQIDYEDKFINAMKDPIWSSWFESISKKDLWIEMLSSKDEQFAFFQNKLELQEIMENIQRRESKTAHQSKAIVWFVVGGLVGTATGWFTF
jgi:hypothetical protein